MLVWQPSSAVVRGSARDERGPPRDREAWLATQYFYFDTHLTLYAPCCSTVPIRWLKMSRSVWRTGFASACISSTKSG